MIVISDLVISYYHPLISHTAPGIINEISSDKELWRKRSSEINQSTPAPNDPSGDKVLVRVKAAGVNPVDWKIREATSNK